MGDDAMQGANGAQMYVHPAQAEAMGAFAGDAALWASDGGPSAGHHMFGATDPMIYLRYVSHYTATCDTSLLVV